MKAIAYHIGTKEKELLILANYKKHDITIIANSLTADTLPFAAGKDALIVFNDDTLDAQIIEGLRALGIKYIVSSSIDCNHINLSAAKKAGLEIASIPFRDNWDLSDMWQVIAIIDNWATAK